MGDDSPQWGSYPAFERKQPERKTLEQQTASDADFAYRQARCERFWTVEQQDNPLWRFALISALMARYEVLGETYWKLVDERRDWIKNAFRDALRQCDKAAAAKDYHCRWLVMQFHDGMKGLQWLEDRAKGVDANAPEA